MLPSLSKKCTACTITQVVISCIMATALGHTAAGNLTCANCDARDERECTLIQSQQRCQNGDVCFTFEAFSLIRSVRNVRRGCFPLSACNYEGLCSSFNSSQNSSVVVCDFHCCNVSLCNSGNLTMEVTKKATTFEATTMGPTTVGETTMGPKTDGATTMGTTTNEATTMGPTTAGETIMGTTLTTDGATTMGTTLTTDGATTMGTTLTTDGATTMETTTNGATTRGPTTAGETTMGTTLTTDGATTMETITNGATTRGPTTAGETTMGTTLTTDGATTMGTTLTTDGATTMETTTNGATTMGPTTAGETTMGTTLTTDGATTMGTTLTSDLATTMETTTDGATTIGPKPDGATTMGPTTDGKTTAVDMVPTTAPPSVSGIPTKIPRTTLSRMTAGSTSPETIKEDQPAYPVYDGVGMAGFDPGAFFLPRFAFTTARTSSGTSLTVQCLRWSQYRRLRFIPSHRELYVGINLLYATSF
ncbi:uncharacterized protein [Montipora foliosa]|uniref:uncharacterized protein isoform X4 n=1 Tax=Montipora foliosa TaxID=591990 RepID=UPI0035F107E5